MKQGDSMRSLFFLSCLPYRRRIYRDGGFRLFPWQSGFDEFIRQYFTPEIIRRAEKRASMLSVRNEDYVTLLDDDYPPLLRHIFDPPPVLFYRGSLPSWDKETIGIVGTRHPVPLAISATELFIKSVSSSAPVIVSGYAKGIDREAHRVALEEGCPTIAVLGSGLDFVENIYDDPEGRLVFLTEFPPDERPSPMHFPRRNRIIAGICQKVIVMQAPYKSGARITASFAMDENRDLFVFDHPLMHEEGVNEGNRLLLEEGVSFLSIPELNIISEPVYDGIISQEQLTFWKDHNEGRLKYMGRNHWLKKRKEWE
jgi:DNA protecting protein DprA